MKNFWICLNVYNEEFLLPECLESIRRHHPEAKIVAVDGAYETFVNETKKIIAHYIEYGQETLSSQLMKYTVPISTDRTLDLLKEAKVDRIIECEKDDQGNPIPWKHEYVKRSKYLVAEPGDYYLVIDADERLVGRVEWETLTDDGYNILLKRDENVGAYPILRMFKHYPGMRYYGAHHAIWINEQLYTKEMCKDLPNVHLFHRSVYRSTRDPIRALAKGAYYRQLTSKEEAGFRAQYGL